jgi:hypothetical protein
MKLSEVFEKAAVTTDDKARRRSNTAPKTLANISAAEIESGVSLERLQALNVPVYQYATQLTIHGQLPEFSGKARPAGYKSIFKNENGTLGIRYVAIDAEKKQILCEAAKLADKERRAFSAHIDSRGLQLSAFFQAKADCLECFKSFPRDWFCGNVFAAAGFFGGYYVVAEVGALPAVTFWEFVKAVYGLTESEFEARKVARAAADAQEEAERKAKHERGMQELRAREERELAALLPTLAALKPCQSIKPELGTRFVIIANTISFGMQPVLVVIHKKAFGKLLFSSISWNDKARDWQPNKQTKSKRVEDYLDGWKAKCEKGWVFSLK